MKGFLFIQMVDSDQQKGPSSNGLLFHMGGYASKYKEKKNIQSAL
jgi:hypothetical protein